MSKRQYIMLLLPMMNTDGRNQWYKNHRKNGKVTAVWAGSVLSYHDMIEHLRPEDFNISYRSRNRFRFMVRLNQHGARSR
jgi:hypothetical protein